MLESPRLSKRFGGIVAADDLDIDLRKGTITALVGPNGAGKTTVFNLLTGFIRPDRGIGAAERRRARRARTRQGRPPRPGPLVPGRPPLQRITCLQNVMLGVQDQPGENVIKLTLGGERRRARAKPHP